jgi:hypothetical protein
LRHLFDLLEDQAVVIAGEGRLRGQCKNRTQS